MTITGKFISTAVNLALCAALAAIVTPAAFAQGGGRTVNKVLAPASTSPIGISDDPILEFTTKLAESYVTFDYTYGVDNKGVKLEGSGSVILQDNSYYIEGDGVCIWCNGNSVWTMDVEANEVVIESPDAANGFTADPILLLTDLGKVYSWDKTGIPMVFSGTDCWEYSLKSKSKTEFSDVKIYLVGDSLAGAVLKSADRTVSFAVSSFEYRPHDSKAVFVPDSFPDDCIVTDLR